jgi:hypothetical protein
VGAGYGEHIQCEPVGSGVLAHFSYKTQPLHTPGFLSVNLVFSGYNNMFIIRKHFFTNRVINIWNSLPENVVAADNINLFKTRLNEHWKTQSVLFDWTADLAGVRSRSFVQSV